MIYKLKPILKQRLWGGNYLPKALNVQTNDKIGEAWILSCIDQNNSPIDDRTNLLDLFKANPAIVGKDYRGVFPLLIKLIDAQDDLSIQVHPEIKTEFWHVLNKKPSKLYMGFNKTTSRKEVEQALNNEQITSLLNHIDVKQNDSYLIKPGTIHAIGKKTFLIEIQQSADITYRLYDYNRVDVNGKHRELHINQALSCINYHKQNVHQEHNEQLLVECPFFKVWKYDVDNQKEFVVDQQSFNAIVILEGTGSIKLDCQQINFKQFDTFFIPANNCKYTITGQTKIIKVSL